MLRVAQNVRFKNRCDDEQAERDKHWVAHDGLLRLTRSETERVCCIFWRQLSCTIGTQEYQHTSDWQLAAQVVIVAEVVVQGSGCGAGGRAFGLLGCTALCQCFVWLT